MIFCELIVVTWEVHVTESYRFTFQIEEGNYPYNDTYRWNQILDSVMPDPVSGTGQARSGIQKSTYGHELK